MNYVTIIFLLTIIITYVNCLPAGSSVHPPIAILAPFNNISEITKKKIADVIGQSKALTLGPQFPDSGRTHAVLEHESGLSKVDTAYGNLQQFVAGFYHPKPIVDTIQEHEKYGNDGEKFRKVGTAIIGGVEGFSNLLNAAVDLPYEVAKQFAKKITESLNTVGAKISGL